MRSSIWLSLVILIAVVALACNSNETLLTPQSPQSASKTSTPAPPATESARHITAEEAHKLWEKNEVIIIDTRTEPAFKQEHIKGAILVSHGTLTAKFAELPRGKMIVAYCTCPHEQTSGAAVLELKAKGIDNAAALTGGLGAWKAAGYPVETSQ